MKKKTKGKGLSVLSGRALFDYDATLFQVNYVFEVLKYLLRRIVKPCCVVCGTLAFFFHARMNLR